MSEIVKQSAPTGKGELLQQYIDTFVPNPSTYAVMNPSGMDRKYSRGKKSLTPDNIQNALTGAPRRLKIDGKWVTVPLSVAIIPQTADELAKNIALDVDDGGKGAVAQVLTVCESLGLWAFAQLSESTKHTGGHVYILGSEYLPSAVLHEVGQRIAQAAEVPCEVYPKDVDLRLPLMYHLHAPGGPARFPLLLQTGEIIEVEHWVIMLADLFTVAQYNDPKTITAALNALPTLPEPEQRPRPRHTSEINAGSVDSVINWYNDTHNVLSELEQMGADVGNGQKSVICCPAHDDQHPSLGIFRNHDGKIVARCFVDSCDLGKKPYYDAFDLFCMRNAYDSAQAVYELVTKHGLGRKREFKITEAAPVERIDPEAHDVLIGRARLRLADELSAAAQRSGVTVIRATPGLGKTHAAAELAQQLHSEGRRVAIAAPTLDIATGEWRGRLGADGYVWQSKKSLCRCHEDTYLDLCILMGYRMPECIYDDCPYAQQAKQARGKIIVYQHAHLHLGDGGAMAGIDTLIIDESPIGALMPEHGISAATLEKFADRHPDDPATPLLDAMAAAALKLPEQIQDVRGPALMAAIQQELNGISLEQALHDARLSPFNKIAPVPPRDAKRMVPQFLGLLLAALHAPTAFNWGKGGKHGNWGFVWQERKPLAAALHNGLCPPAVIVLDGSADQVVAEQLYKPWPVHFIEISAPLSPLVEIIQVNCTPSTRQIVRDADKTNRLARAVAITAEQVGVVLDGGITYQGAVDEMAAVCGGQWLHFGGQRGSNALADAGAIAVVASPTAPPVAVERRALALWPDVTTEWVATGKTGEYVASDDRMQRLNLLTGPEELRQSIFRVRPLTAAKETKLLIFTPWSLDSIGIQPNRVIDEIPYGNSNEAAALLAKYEERRRELSSMPVGGGRTPVALRSTPPTEDARDNNDALQEDLQCNKKSLLEYGREYKEEFTPHIPKLPFCCSDEDSTAVIEQIPLIETPSAGHRGPRPPADRGSAAKQAGVRPPLPALKEVPAALVPLKPTSPTSFSEVIANVPATLKPWLIRALASADLPVVEKLAQEHGFVVEFKSTGYNQFCVDLGEAPRKRKR